MNITLFGRPKTGKTTLFNLLCGAHVELGGYEDGRREPNVRTYPLPDARLDAISALYPDKKKVAASLDVTDLAGISLGEVKDSLLLAHLRKADGLVHVVRAFRDERVPAAGGRVDPTADIRAMEEEIVLADLVLVEGRLERLERDLKKMKDPEGEKELELLKRLRPPLEAGRSLSDFAMTPAEEKLIRSFALLTLKPLLHAVNLDEADLAFLPRPADLLGIEAGGRRLAAFCGRIEAELAELPDEEKAVFSAEYGLCESSVVCFNRQVPAFLDRIAFFTVGKDEVRAWTIKKGSTAVKAAGAIHTDIEKGFIRAEVIGAEDLLRLGSLQHAKEAGAIRLEGKEYVVRDGDVIYFRFAQ